MAFETRSRQYRMAFRTQSGTVVRWKNDNNCSRHDSCWCFPTVVRAAPWRRKNAATRSARYVRHDSGESVFCLALKDFTAFSIAAQFFVETLRKNTSNCCVETCSGGSDLVILSSLRRSLPALRGCLWRIRRDCMISWRPWVEGMQIEERNL